MRKTFIDITKGLGILLVLLGHTYDLPNWLHMWIYSFHMPLFFILSGYVFNIKKYKNISVVNYVFVAGNCKKYILYYFVFA